VISAAGQNGGTCQAKSGSGTTYAPNGDAAADSAVALTSKELFAAVSDPEGDGWSDASGAEIGDKCDWTYGTVQSNGSNLTLGGHAYIVPEEWSNSDQSCILSPTWSTTVAVAQGWSLIDLPAQTTGITSTSSLITALDASNQLGANAVQVVATYGNGRFSLYVPGYSSDQSLQPTQGIFIDSQTAGTWSVSSPAYTTSQSVTLQPGWNLVAAPYPVSGLSSSAILSETAGCGVSEVATYSGGAYQVYTPGGSSGTVASTQGMWLLCTTTSSWTPS
jgi:hypothetical protein